MSDRERLTARILCMLLGALLVAQLARSALSKNPLNDLSVPPGFAEFVNVGPSSPLQPAGAAPTTEQTRPVPKPSTSVTQAGSNSASARLGAPSSSAPGSPPTSASPGPATPPSPSPAAGPRGANKPAPMVPGPGMMGGPGGALAAFPEGVRGRIEKVRDSEILGPVPRPMPMALIGIVGPDVMLRSPTGQTGLLREGEELGGVKLIKIGTNRVLVEHEGQRKELMIFSGFGSDSLMPTGKDQKP